jgi:hypothetical protein
MEWPRLDVEFLPPALTTITADQRLESCHIHRVEVERADAGPDQ